MNFLMFKLVLENAEEPEIKFPSFAGSWKKQESKVSCLQGASGAPSLLFATSPLAPPGQDAPCTLLSPTPGILPRLVPHKAEDQPVHGDLDLVMNLMDAHKVRVTAASFGCTAPLGRTSSPLYLHPLD